MQDVRTAVLDVLGSQFDVDTASIEDDNTLVGDLGLDSIEIVQLGIDLEEAFGVELPDHTVSGGMTVGELCTAIKQQIGV